MSDKPEPERVLDLGNSIADAYAFGYQAGEKSQAERWGRVEAKLDRILALLDARDGK